MSPVYIIFENANQRHTDKFAAFLSSKGCTFNVIKVDTTQNMNVQEDRFIFTTECPISITTEEIKNLNLDVSFEITNVFPEKLTYKYGYVPSYIVSERQLPRPRTPVRRKSAPRRRTPARKRATPRRRTPARKRATPRRRTPARRKATPRRRSRR